MKESIQVNCHVNSFLAPIRATERVALIQKKKKKSRFLFWEPHYQLSKSFQVLKQCPQDKMYANQRPLVAIRAFAHTGADESTFGVRVWSLTWQTKTRLRWGNGEGGVIQSSSQVTDQESGIIWAAVNTIFLSSTWPLLSLWYAIVNGIQNRRATHWSEMRTMQGARVPITFAMGEGPFFWSGLTVKAGTASHMTPFREFQS